MGGSESLEAGVTIHDAATVSPSASLGRGTVVWQYATICSGVITGEYCAIGSGAYIGHYAHLGERVRIQHGVFLPNRSRVGSDVFIGPNATLTDDKHPKVNNPNYRAQPPIVEDNVNIGANATILPGVRLGRGCTVAAGAVVTQDVEPWTTVMGVPAREYRKQQKHLADS